MKVIKNLIAQITKRKSLKRVLVFLMVGGLFVGSTYAVGTEESTLDMTAFLLDLLLKFASWAWIIPATLAGKLMTNDVLYGSFMNLDASLWTLRNIMKNFANFALGFFVLFAIVKNVFSVFGSNDGDWSPLNVIKKTLIAGVLIQMSWFLMGALVDLSTILTSAIGSFPSQLIASSSEMRGNVRERLKDLKKGEIIFDVDDKANPIKFEANTGFNYDDEDRVNELLDSIMPSHGSLGGPLIFLGMAVFDFNDFSNYNDTGAITEREDLLLSLSLDAIVIIGFTVMMCLIFLFNLFRILILWILIPLLPVIVLLNVFGILDKMESGGTGLDLKSLMSVKTIINLVFKPVIMVGALSLILIVLVLIKTVIAGNDTGTIDLSEHGNMQIVSTEVEGVGYSSTIKSAGIFEFSMDDTKNTIADIIVYFFGLFLVYLLVKFAAEMKTGIGFVDNAIEGTFGFVEDLAKNLPVVPIGGGVGIKTLTDNLDTEKIANNYMGINVSAQEAMVDKLFNVDKSKAFNSMSVSGDKEEFINNAKSIADKNRINHADMFKNESFEKKLAERDENNKNNENNKITVKDFQQK